MKPYSENKKLKVIEMIAGPGAGKSSAALLLAGHMKARGYKVEYVREVAKDLIHDGHTRSPRDPSLPDHSMFTEQDWILATQNNLYRRMLAHDIEYLVTDTSLLLGLIYKEDWYPESFKDYLMDVYQSYTNITFYVERGNIPYVQDGRNEDSEQAKQKDKEASYLLQYLKVPYVTVQQKAWDFDHAALQMLDHIIQLQK